MVPDRSPIPEEALRHLQADTVRRRLAERDSVRVDLPYVESAVMMLLRSGPAGTEALYTVRSREVPTHKGHIAFPGGKIDPDDAGPLAAALRETDEEVGIPRGAIAVLGALDDVVTLSKFRITPFVGWLAPDHPLHPNDREIAEVFFAPLVRLADPRAWRIHVRESDGLSWPSFCCDFEGRILWGATARMTVNFLERIAGWTLPV